jgi:hypothetical protein
MRFATLRRIVDLPQLHAAFALVLTVAACGDGGPSVTEDAISQEKAALATRTIPVPPTPPVAEGAQTVAPGRERIDALTARRPATAYVSECVVDFTDSTALQMSEPSLWFDRLYVPWFQQCGGLGYVDMRSLVVGHYHLNFADSDVLPCNTHVQAYPARIGDDGTCDLVDVPTEPRTYVTTHSGAEILRIMAEKADHTTRAAFDLNRIKIPGTQPVRLCYKKRVDGPIGPWEAAEPGGGSPGVWLCWNQLDPGTWDLSDWVWDVMEVKVTGTPGVSVNFSIDDLHVGIR